MKTGPLHIIEQSTVGLTHTEQEAAQIKEDLKNKQMLKELEAKRRGSSHSPYSVCAIITPHS